MTMPSDSDPAGELDLKEERSGSTLPPSTRLTVAGSYFTASGALAALLALFRLLRHLGGAPWPPQSGSSPSASLLLLAVASVLWIGTGIALFAHRRIGAVLAIATLLLQAAGWFQGAPPSWGELLLTVGGIALVASTWGELRW